MLALRQTVQLGEHPILQGAVLDRRPLRGPALGAREDLGRQAHHVVGGEEVDAQLHDLVHVEAPRAHGRHPLDHMRLTEAGVGGAQSGVGIDQRGEQRLPVEVRVDAVLISDQRLDLGRLVEVHGRPSCCQRSRRRSGVRAWSFAGRVRTDARSSAFILALAVAYSSSAASRWASMAMLRLEKARSCSG